MPGIPLKRLTSTKRSNSTSWIKNAAKSLGMVGVDVLADLNPTIAEVTTTSMKTSQEVYKQIRTGNINSNKVSNAIKGNRYVKLGQTAIKNALEDLKTGNFNNQERFNNSLFGDDDSGMNFGDFDDFGGDDSGSNINIIETGLSQESVAQLGEISQRNTEAIVKSAQATIDANIGMATASMMQFQEFGNKITGKLDTANNHLAALVEFNNANMLKFIEASTAYYEKMGSAMTENGDPKKQKMTADEAFLDKKTGGLNFQKYGILVQQQMKDYFENSQAGMLADMVNNFGDAIVANPLNMVSKFLIESAIPDMVKNTMEEVDEAMSGAMVTLLQRLGNNWGNASGDGIGSMIKRFVGNTFGLNTKAKEGIDLSNKVTAEPATFDGYTHHAINEIIPKYLRESTAYLKTIAEHITGDSAGALRSADVFDYKTGTYKTLGQVKKEVYSEIRDNTALAVRESAFGKAMVRAGMAGDVDSDDYNNALNDFLYRLTMNGTPDFSDANWMSQIDAILGNTSGTDKTKQYLRAAVESSVKDRNSGAAMAPGLLAGQAARNRTLKDMENDATGYNLYATSPDGGDLESTMATVLYASEGGDSPENRIRKHGSISDVLDNINYLLERGINVRNTGKNPYPKDYGIRPNKRGIPVVQQSRSRQGTILNGARNVAGFVNNLINGGEEEPQNQNPEQNATSELSEEEIREAVNDIMQSNPEDETVKGFAGRFQKMGKGIVGGIYDILQGNIRGGFKQMSEAAGGVIDPNGKLRAKAEDKLFGEAELDENGEVKRDEHGNIIRKSDASLFGSARDKVNGVKGKITDKVKSISNMKVDDVKEGVMEFLFGHKVEDLPPQMLYKIYGKRVEAGQRLGSKNGVIRAITDTFRDGMYGFYESFFGDTINTNDPPSKIRKQMKEGIQKKFKDTMDSIKENTPKELQDTIKTMKLGAGRGAAGGAIGFMLGGPVGAIAGASLGMFTKSNMYQDFMFGPESNGVRSGGFKDKVYKAWDEFKEKHHIGKEVDPKTGKTKFLSKSNKMALTGASLGFLASAFLPVGPVGGAIAGLALGIAAGEGKVHDFLFGKKTKNSETGEEQYEKGLLGRLGTLAEVKLLDPMKNAIKYTIQDATDFVKDNVFRTIENGLAPVMTSIGIIFEETKNKFLSKLSAMGKTVSGLMQGLVGFVDRKIFKPAGNFIKDHILNSKIGKAVQGAVGGVLDKLNPVKAAQRFNERKSLERRINELRDIADHGSPEEAAKAREKLALLESNGNSKEAEAAKEKARNMYYNTNYKRLRDEQMEDRGARLEQRRVEREGDAVAQRNREFISTVTGGRLKEDTPENRAAAMAEFEKGLKGTIFGRKYKGYKKGFQFQDYDPVEGKALNAEVDKATVQTASNTEEMKQQLSEISAHLEDVKKQRSDLIQSIEDKKNRRKAEGIENYSAIDDDDYNKMQQFDKSIERLEQEKEKAERHVKTAESREKRHEFVDNVADKVGEKVGKAAEVVDQKVGNPLRILRAKMSKGWYNYVNMFDPEKESWEDYQTRIHSEAYKQEQEMEKVKGNADQEALLRGKFREQEKRRREAEEAKARMEQMEQEAAEANSGDAEAEPVDEEAGGSGNLRGYARGTRNATPGAHIVGELGPEILHIPKGSHVDPNDKVINVRITDIDKKGWKKFVKLTDKKEGQLKMALGASTDILPVYNMGTIGSETANISRILGQVRSDGNINVDAIDDDIMDDLKNNANATEGDGKKKDEEDKGWFDTLKDTFTSFGAKVGEITTLLGLFGSAIPGAIGVAELMSWVSTMFGKDKKSSNSNENTAEVDENGIIQLNEDGTIKQYDATEEDKKNSIWDNIRNRIAPKRTKIDLETGEAVTKTDFNNNSFNEANHIRGAWAGIQMSKELMPKMAAKVAEKAATGKGIIGGGAKLLTGIGNTARSIGRGVTGTASAIGTSLKNSGTGQAVATVADSIGTLIESFKAKIAPMVDDMIKLITDKLAKTKFGKGVAEKIAPKITKLFSFSDDVLKASSTKIAEFMGKIGARANVIGIAIEVGGIVLGGINGLTSMGYMFDIDPKDPNIGPWLRGIMTTISTILGAFQGSSIGALIDLGSSLLGFEVYKWLGKTLLNAILTLFGQQDSKDALAAAQQSFQEKYNEYSKAEYDAYCKHAQSLGEPVPSYEDFIANDLASTSFEEFNNDFNANITARAGDWLVDNFGKVKDAAAKAITGNASKAIANKMIPKESPSDATPVDSTDTTGVDEGMGGFGNGTPYYSQNDPRWKNAGYGTSDHATMGEAGCGPTAMAMAASKASGQKINPMQMANFAQKNGFRDETGTNSKFVQAASNSLGLSTTSTKSPDENFIHNELSQGKPVVLLGRDGGYGNSAFTKAGHYVVATGETPDGGIMINDPRGKQFSGKYNKDEVLGESAKAWSIGGRGNETTNTQATPSGPKGLMNAMKNTTEFAVGQATSNGLGVRPEDVIQVAMNELGYHEKASNSQLDDKYANQGSANFTKYGAWFGVQDKWCCMFVCWCFTQAANGDREVAKQLLCGPLTAGCSALWSNFQKAGRITNDPQPGDVVFYSYSHVGIVTRVENGKFYTIEGNTSAKNPTSSARDDGVVAEKEHPITYKDVKGFGRPMYDTASKFKGLSPVSSASVDGTAMTTADGSGVSAMQMAKNAISAGLAGLFDKAALGVKNFWETGVFNTESDEGATEVQYDENGNPINGDATASVVGVSGMSDIDPAQFTSDIPHAEAAFKYFVSQGYSPAAAAGIIGNLMHESGGADLNPSVIQGKGKGPAAGIAQWENYNEKSSRWLALSQFAQSKGKDWTDFGSQVEFIHHELSGDQKSFFGKTKGMTAAGTTPTTYEEWMKTDDVEQATRQFEGAFERAGTIHMEPRLSYAKGVYNKFVGTTMDAKDVTSEDAQLTSVGDLRRQEAAARQDTSSGMGGFGDVDSDFMDTKYLDKDAMNGGFGPEVQSYTPSKPVSKQASSIAKSPNNGAGFNGETFAKQMVQYLQAIAENTGVSASKLDYLKSLPTGASTTVNQGSTLIQAGNNAPISFPPGKTTKQQKAERIALG